MVATQTFWPSELISESDYTHFVKHFTLTEVK